MAKIVRGWDVVRLWFVPQVLIDEINENRVRIRRLEKRESLGVSGRHG